MSNRHLQEPLHTQCGGTIGLNVRSRKHLRAHPEVMPLLPEAISQLVLPRGGVRLEAEVNFKRPIGAATLIEVPYSSPSQWVTFAQRSHRVGPSRITATDSPTTIQTLVVVADASATQANHYRLVTAYIGILTPPEPWDIRLNDAARTDALEFWCRHAIVYNPAPGVMAEMFVDTWASVLARGRAESTAGRS